MKNKRTLLLGAAVLAIGITSYYVFAAKNSTPVNKEAERLFSVAQRLSPLHGPIGPSSWLQSHHENGQTFGQYSRINHIRLTEKRNVLYVMPLGEFNEKQMKIVELSAEFLRHYFMCDVRTLETRSLDIIPQKARRVHPSWGMRQIHSKYVLDELLPPLLPDDAVALIAFSSSDLYPQDDWNFVYGQASLKQRVGVWSIFRNGDPETEFETVLRRTVKTATHETGHMFTIQHCIAYECNMCGSNNMEESDQHPVFLCPECVAKVWWSTKCDPIERFEKLKKFCLENGLADEAEHYAKSIEAIRGKEKDE